MARLNLPGRPAAYSVTNEFLRSCGIEKVEDLPDYENIKIKDEQMLVTDYSEDSEENVGSSVDNNEEVETEETKE